MKKLMITLMLSMFCWSAFAIVPQQDTTRRRQDTTKKHPVKSKMKKKYPGKDTTKKDTVKRRTGDTSRRVPPVM